MTIQKAENLVGKVIALAGSGKGDEAKKLAGEIRASFIKKISFGLIDAPGFVADKISLLDEIDYSDNSRKESCIRVIAACPICDEQMTQEIVSVGGAIFLDKVKEEYFVCCSEGHVIEFDFDSHVLTHEPV